MTRIKNLLLLAFLWAGQTYCLGEESQKPAGEARQNASDYDSEDSDSDLDTANASVITGAPDTSTHVPMLQPIAFIPHREISGGPRPYIPQKTDIGCSPMAIKCSRAAIEGDIACLNHYAGRLGIDYSDENGMTLLMRTAASGSEAGVSSLLAKKKIDKQVINARDNDGMTALMHAAASGHVAALNLLLNDNRTDILVRDASGNNALIHAAINGRERAVSALLQRMSVDDVLSCNKTCASGLQCKTVFRLAVEKNYSHVVNVLVKWSIKTGAKFPINDLQLAFQKGMLACENSSQYSKQTVAPRFARNRVESELLKAASDGDDNSILTMIASEIDLGIRDQEGNTPLMRAILAGHFSTFRLLLNNMKKEDVLASNFIGSFSKDARFKTPLELAHNLDKTRFVRALLNWSLDKSEDLRVKFSCEDLQRCIDLGLVTYEQYMRAFENIVMIVDDRAAKTEEGKKE